jgi:translation initiation factor IF-3
MQQSDFWERLKKRLIEVSNATADFAEEQAMIGKLKFDILNLKRKVDRALHDIGSRVLEMSRATPDSNPLQDREIKDLLALIADLEVQVERKRKEIGMVADQVRGRRQADNGAKAQASAPKAPPPAAKSAPAAKPAPVKPAAPKPPVNKPAATKPVAAKPAATKPAAKSASNSKPAVAKPSAKPKTSSKEK